MPRFSALCSYFSNDWAGTTPTARFVRPQMVLGSFFLLLTTTYSSSDVAPLRVIGGIAGVTQYEKFEEPFWTSEIAKISGGRIKAVIHPFDRAGLPGAEMLQLIKTGVVPFGTVLLSRVADDEPALGAVDLPMLNPDIATLRENVEAFRPHMKALLSERYNIELLGIYIYPAQVVFCAKPFDGLADLTGRKIRTSSVGQSEVALSLGAIPVKTSFGEIVPGIMKGVVDCAVTGTMSGNQIGLAEVTSHLHPIAISWGVSFFGANADAWNTLAADVRSTIRPAVADLEARIWQAAEAETANGVACNLGRETCQSGRRANMKALDATAEDDAARKRILREVALPRWLERCGEACADLWNQTIGRKAKLYIRNDHSISPTSQGAP